MDIHQFYPQQGLSTANSPIAYVIHTGVIQDCALKAIGRVLSIDELELLPFALDDADSETVWAAAVHQVVAFAKQASKDRLEVVR